ncbi:hypothetical protein J7E25_13350 [Agromyces sp. ISL-38]|uniref:hypothetical protein n=1 Tax=Agromyces sp. ISL-38 TaxID=2819107 RepID=UPI001BE81CC7|nr:hypothetical protein [Agromyces sp. ISL-38]MBT2500074.1 hypothetical protein [Agromyces sp. ISL-38]MBT2516752.1 hypothetical protein [Streptomyces sp. ISL-90]
MFGEDLAGVPVDDHGLVAGGEQDDRVALVAAADAEVAEFPGVADGDLAVRIARVALST